MKKKTPDFWLADLSEFGQVGGLCSEHLVSNRHQPALHLGVSPMFTLMLDRIAPGFFSLKTCEFTSKGITIIHNQCLVCSMKVKAGTCFSLENMLLVFELRYRILIYGYLQPQESTKKRKPGPPDAKDEEIGVAFDASSRLRRAGVEFYHDRRNENGEPQSWKTMGKPQ